VVILSISSRTKVNLIVGVEFVHISQVMGIL
jgi:hypothetical protein